MSLSSTESTVLLPACSTRRPKPPRRRAGRSSSRSARPSMKRVMRCGASRKSSTFWAGGVSRTIRSNEPSSTSSCRRSTAIYSCAPATAPDR